MRRTTPALALLALTPLALAACTSKADSNVDAIAVTADDTTCDVASNTATTGTTTFTITNSITGSLDSQLTQSDKDI